MADSIERERFALLLPFYINGTLAEDDRRFMEGWLANHAEARLELAFSQRIRSEIRRLESRRPADGGIDLLLAASRGRREPLRLPWLRRSLAVPLPALVLVALLVALQILSIVALLPRADLGEGGNAALRGPTRVVVEVDFATGTLHSEMVELLHRAGAEIVAGPNPDGRFRVAFAGIATPEEAVARLKSSPLVSSVQALAAGR